MKRIAAVLLITLLAFASLPAYARQENKAIGENGREARKAAKQQQKYSKQQARRQRRQMKKYQKDQRRAAKRQQSYR